MNIDTDLGSFPTNLKHRGTELANGARLDAIQAATQHRSQMDFQRHMVKI